MIFLKAQKTFVSFLLGFLCISSFYAQSNQQVKLPYKIDFNKIESERDKINYNLDEIVRIISDSIKLRNKIIIPKVCTEFEKALFTARRIQHNDSQLVAIKIFKTLLEFECYRTKGEEQYIRLMLGLSIKYLGASHLAYEYISNIFPAIFTELTDPISRGNFLSHYAGILIQVDSVEAAKKIFERNLLIYSRMDVEEKVYSTRNNLGYTYTLLEKYDFAKALFKQNQREDLKSLNPILHAFSFGNYGKVLYKEHQYDSALYYYKKERDLLLQVGTNEGLPNLYSSFGDTYMKKGLLDSASHFYHLSLEESILTNELSKTVKRYEDLMRVYSLKEQKPEFSDLLERYLVMSDSLNNRIRLNEANVEVQVAKFLQIFSDTTESKRRNDDLEKEYEDLTNILIALSIVTLLLLFILYLRNHNRKKLKAKNVELKTKNIELEKSYQIISESNGKNEVLLKELHHRVKNNLQIISSLFNLQLNASELNREAKTVFQDAQNRIQSIASVHKKMYQSNNVDSLDFEQYILDFSSDLIKLSSKEVLIDINIQRDPISIESAVPLGLIFNELLTNSLKYAVYHESLKITIDNNTVDGTERFTYTDNGVGFTNSKRLEDSKKSIGFSLIDLLASQLGATIKYNGDNGFWFSIEGNFE